MLIRAEHRTGGPDVLSCRTGRVLGFCPVLPLARTKVGSRTGQKILSCAHLWFVVLFIIIAEHNLNLLEIIFSKLKIAQNDHHLKRMVHLNMNYFRFVLDSCSSTVKQMTYDLLLVVIDHLRYVKIYSII